MSASDPQLFVRIGLGLLEHLARHPPAAAPSGRVILVTSAFAGEGKSFVAQGLAFALAEQQGGDVVCVDAAFGRPSADKEPSRKDAAGLSEAMMSGSLKGLALTDGGPERLWRLGRGATARRSLLYRPDGVRKGLTALRAAYALTVLDGPTLDSCGALLTEVDACLLVLDARRTSRHAAQRALADADIAPDRMAGLVLNHRPRPVPHWLGGD